MRTATAQRSPQRPVQRPNTGYVPRPKGYWLTRVMEGSYALQKKPEHGGAIHFFKVEHGKRKWEGCVFVVESIGGNHRPVRDAEERELILGAIEREPFEAEALYGREMGECGKCGTPLTSEWRQYGIGPDCARKYYGLTLGQLKKKLQGVK